MRRRDFIKAVAGSAMTWPLVVRAQQLGTKVARIGLLMPVSAASAAQNLAALRRGLRELGYVEGKNISIEQRGWRCSGNSYPLQGVLGHYGIRPIRFPR